MPRMGIKNMLHCDWRHENLVTDLACGQKKYASLLISLQLPKRPDFFCIIWALNVCMFLKKKIPPKVKGCYIENYSFSNLNGILE